MQEMKKYKYIIAVFIIGCVCGIFIVGKRFYDYYSWAEKRPTNYHTSRKQVDDTLRVIMIGDSWAAYHHNYDTILATMLQEKLHKPINVTSSGMVGAKTKKIYELMYDSITDHGTKKKLQENPHYCIISAGINDAVAKMEPNNYIYHYNLIIKQLLTNNIIPVIIDMPNIDYKSVYQRETYFAKIRHRFSCFLNNIDMWSFEKYRKSLKGFTEKELNNKNVIYINAQDWNPKGFMDTRILYQQDHVHLNQKGYLLLDSCIAAHIARDYANHDNLLSH